MANTTLVKSTTINTTTISSFVSTTSHTSLVSSVSNFFTNFEISKNLWLSMGAVALCVLVLGSAIYIITRFCCRTKISQQESWCWCIFCCPEIELPMVAKKVQKLPAHAPINAWAPPPNTDQLYGQPR